MLSPAVSRWLSEYKSLKDAQIPSYAHTIRNDQELIEDLYQLFDDVTVLCSEVIDPVCHQLFDFYRSLNVELQRFTLEIVPSLIWTYLQALANNDKSKCGGIEACLLGIYNLEVVDKDGKIKVKEVTIPTLACVSLYHEPPSLASQVLTESALMRYHSDKPIVIEVGRLPQVENINAQNRLPVLSYIINRYNADITNLSQRSHQFLCQVCSRLAKSGFGGLGETIEERQANGSLNGTLSRTPKRVVSFVESNRIPLSSGILVELLTAVYYAMYNGQARDARRALDDIHFRASYEWYSEVMLVTNAIRNSLDMNSASAQPMDGPMGISIALSPAQGNPAFNKDAITNASFRAKRLPEDIEVLDESTKHVSEVPPVIVEESPEGDGHSLSTRTSTSDMERLKSSPGVKVPKGQQLKSIMKKREKGDKEKVHRKESTDASMNSLPPSAGGKRGSHFKDHLLNDLQQQRSPKHSASSTGIAGGTSVVNGNDIADIGAIHMHVIRSNSNRAVSAEQVDIVGGMGTTRVSETALFNNGGATDDAAVTLAVRSSTGSAGQSNNHSKHALFFNGAAVMPEGEYDDSFENEEVNDEDDEGHDATKL